MNSNTSPIVVNPLIILPQLPRLISNWIAVVPLVVHLATPRADYLTTGDIALNGRLVVSLFPRLGTYLGYTRLLTRGDKFIDFASTRSGSNRMVWDVSWGSTFPCANGSACSAVLKCLMRKSNTPPISMPEKLPELIRSSTKLEKPVQVRVVESTTFDKAATKGNRCQTLHVFRFKRTSPGSSRKHHVTSMLEGSKWYQIACCIFPVLVGVLLILCGSPGSACITFCCAISRVMSRCATICRPPGYLENKEKHDAYMLVASHQNATEWNLLIGDRGVVNSLLNKPAFTVNKSRRGSIVACWFWTAHVLQLAAMTFITTVGGLDGLACLILIMWEWATTVYCNLPWSDRALSWLRREQVDADVRSFTFHGRMVMIAGIQVFSGAKGTRWMDDILVPHPRREALMESIHGGVAWERGLNASEKSLVISLREASLASAAVLQAQLPTEAHV